MSGSPVFRISHARLGVEPMWEPLHLNFNNKHNSGDHPFLFCFIQINYKYGCGGHVLKRKKVRQGHNSHKEKTKII